MPLDWPTKVSLTDLSGTGPQTWAHAWQQVSLFKHSFQGRKNYNIFIKCIVIHLISLYLFHISNKVSCFSAHWLPSHTFFAEGINFTWCLKRNTCKRLENDNAGNHIMLKSYFLKWNKNTYVSNNVYWVFTTCFPESEGSCENLSYILTINFVTFPITTEKG